MFYDSEFENKLDKRGTKDLNCDDKLPGNNILINSALAGTIILKYMYIKHCKISGMFMILQNQEIIK